MPANAQTYARLSSFVTRLGNVWIFSNGVLPRLPDAPDNFRVENVCDNVYHVGETHPKTREKLEVHYLKFSNWYMESLNPRNTKPFDVEFYFSLKNPIARHLYGLFDVLLYEGNGRAQKRFDELCVLLKLMAQKIPWHMYSDPPKQPQLPELRRQLRPAIDELKQKGYLKSCRIPNAKSGIIEVEAGARFYQMKDAPSHKVDRIVSTQKTKTEARAIKNHQTHPYELSALELRNLFRNKTRKIKMEASQSVDSEPKVDLDNLLKKTCEIVGDHFKILPEDILSTKRAHDIALARHIAIYLFQRAAKITIRETAKFFRLSSHSVVHDAIQPIKRLRKENQVVAEIIDIFFQEVINAHKNLETSAEIKHDKS